MASSILRHPLEDLLRGVLLSGQPLLQLVGAQLCDLGLSVTGTSCSLRGQGRAHFIQSEKAIYLLGGWGCRAVRILSGQCINVRVQATGAVLDCEVILL